MILTKPQRLAWPSPCDGSCGRVVGACGGDDPSNFWIVIVLLVLGVCLTMPGCVPAQPERRAKPFETTELDAALAIVIDMSGSFSESWSDRAYNLFLQLADQFFTVGAGDESRIVIAQLSGGSRVVLFEGRPADLRSTFASPGELNAFLREHSDPTSSPVYHATERAVDYVSTMQGVSENTRLMTVVLSDMVDTHSGGQRRDSGAKMLDALKRYRQLGGGLALYFVAPELVPRWRRILDEAGFEPGAYAIESTLVANPRLPQFD